jgi:hypothetical protein
MPDSNISLLELAYIYKDLKEVLEAPTLSTSTCTTDERRVAADRAAPALEPVLAEIIIEFIDDDAAAFIDGTNPKLLIRPLLTENGKVEYVVAVADCEWE